MRRPFIDGAAYRRQHGAGISIYETNAGKHVFAKVTRSVFADDRDTHEAEVFDLSPSSVPSQLLRSARGLTRSRARSLPCAGES